MFVILLLAAGEGTRFRDAGGHSHKLLAEVTPGRTVLRQACETLLTVGWPVHVVMGAEESGIRNALDGLPVHFIPNPDAASGLSSTIRRGVAATNDADGWLLALADMPFIQPSTVHQVADALQAGAPVAFASCQGKRGHPVGFAAHFYTELVSLAGDSGAQKILAAHAEACVAVHVNDQGILRDVDVPADLLPDSAP